MDTKKKPRAESVSHKVVWVFLQAPDEVRSHVEKSCSRLGTLPKRSLGFTLFQTTSLPASFFLLLLLPGEVNKITEEWNILETFFLAHQTGLAQMNCTGWCTPKGEGRWGCPITWFSSRTECGLCTHVARWVWSGGRGINPPSAAAEGCSVLAQYWAHTGKCFPAPVPVLQQGQVSQQGRAPRLGMLSPSPPCWGRLCSLAAHRCDNLVVLTPGREWPALPLPMKSSISSFPPDKHSSHQNFFSINGTGHFCSSNNLPCITDRYQCSQGVSLFPPFVFAFDLSQPVGYKTKLCTTLDNYIYLGDPGSPKL